MALINVINRQIQRFDQKNQGDERSKESYRNEKEKDADNEFMDVDTRKRKRSGKKRSL